MQAAYAFGFGLQTSVITATHSGYGDRRSEGGTRRTHGWSVPPSRAGLSTLVFFRCAKLAFAEIHFFDVHGRKLKLWDAV